MKIISRHPCLLCSHQQENCCCYYVPLTSFDIKKILARGFKLKDFVMVNRYSKSELKNEDNWWIKNMIKINNKYYRLTTKLTRAGHCFFLKNGVGCILGKDRPLECKLYPFWFNQKMEIVRQDQTCYFFRKNLSNNEVMKIIGENDKKTWRYFQKIKKDFIKKYHWHKKLVKLLLKN